MKRSFEEDGEGATRAARQRRDNAGGWGVLSFFKHVPILNKLVGDDDDNQLEELNTMEVASQPPRKSQPISPARRANASPSTSVSDKRASKNHATTPEKAPSPGKPLFETESTSETFVFTRKNHQLPSKQQKVIHSSVHDQTIDDADFYTPGSFAPRPQQPSTPIQVEDLESSSTTLAPIQLFGDSSKQSRLSRGGLIKKYVLSREERRQRRPVPSRLLANHSTNAQEHSRLVTERILATLNAMDADPMTNETRKPIPSMSMSWGKYQLDVLQEDSLPPLPLQGVAKPPISSLPLKPTTALRQDKESSSKSIIQPSNVRELPKATATTSKPTAPQLFGFSTPSDTFGSVASEAETLLNKPIKYSFSKPTKVAPPKNSTQAAKPYQFVNPPVRAPSPKRNGISTSTVDSALASSSSTNPLQKFMVKAPGSWTCSSCLVNNLDAELTKCPSCETPKAGSSSPAKAPAPLSSSNPLARFMQHEAGSWACPSCKVRNSPATSKCPCCDTPKPGQEDKPTEAKTSPSADKLPGISFGVQSGSNPPSTPAPFGFGTSTEKAPGVSFGISSSSVSSDKPVAPTVSFGSDVAAKSDGADKPSSTGFSFGVPSSKPTESKTQASGFSFAAGSTGAKPTFGGFGAGNDKSDKTAASNEVATESTDKSVSFGFSAATEKSDKPSFSFASADKSSSGGFSFGGKSANDKAADDKPSAVPEKAPTDKPATAPTEKPTATFGFGGADKPASTLGFGSLAAAKGSEAADKSSTAPPPGTFSFSMPSATAEKSSDEPPQKKTFVFGGSDTPGDSSSSSSFGFTPSSAPAATPAVVSKKRAAESDAKETSGFKFGAGTSGFGSASSTSSASFGASDKPAFGAAADKPTFGAAPNKPSFGASADKPSFGTTSDKPTFGALADKPTFGATSDKPALGFEKPSFGATSSTFGASATATAPTTASAAPSSTFVFGSSTPATTSSSASQPTFGSSSGAAFGSTAAAPSNSSSSTFSFGGSSGSSNAFGASASTTPAPTFGAPSASFGAPSTSAPATTTFGASAPSLTTFGTGSSTFNFGTPAPATTGAFGAPAPASTATTAFGASTSAPTFGASASSTPAFGATPAFGTPAASTSGFGSSAPATAFGATASFGASAPSANAFGAAPATAFGASAPPATPSPGGFGASFGAPTPAASTGFGGGGFGGATGGFGAPAPSGFGQPPAAAGGFNMGVDPKKQGRRILTAKRTSRRQSQNA
ncbi:hypothetical protein Ae201684P_006141 [Aphanomyces euteiches]|uniref:RanBP2-type domain-containing protein n=1 Tax=Aphanomyces euteiches TaxID=100861 RepID=A0A6G0XC98_9STRA|nr:hypothetical protein Ae201684_006319 [Aphanomyces euteiches]KAH9090735.1 hypothetical protein Ae201684P_006141 [Aphanomyces euteiches]